MKIFENLFSKGYKGHPEAVIISCFFNPQNSDYRLMAFNEFYKSIKHLNHLIIECVIGDSKPQLPESESIQRVYTESLLWHKETLLNVIVSRLPKKYKYVFWIDADVLFSNKNWLTESVEQLQSCNILQPFEYCIHLEKDELKPSYNPDDYKDTVSIPNLRKETLWRSFCANYVTKDYSGDSNYDRHGHVGFAWGARREILEQVPLYDKALIGGADHIIAHAAAGHIPHSCITKSFTDNIEEVLDWSRQFYTATKGRIGYAKGNLFHIWHGDINKRQYLKRVQEFTVKAKEIVHRDKNGLFVHRGDNSYMANYYKQREVTTDDGFLNSMMIGYMTNSSLLGMALGGNPAGAIIGDMLNDSENQQGIQDYNPDSPRESATEQEFHHQTDVTPSDSTSFHETNDTGVESGNFS